MIPRTVKINDMSPYLQDIVREMCRRVGANPEEIDFGPKVYSKDEWYHLYQWTEEDMYDFLDWVGEYFYNNRKARIAAGIFSRSRIDCRKAANWFALSTWDFKKQDDGKN